MSACINCPGPNVVHQHVAEGGAEALARAMAVTRHLRSEERDDSEPVVPIPGGPVATKPGCQHAECILEHPHSGPAHLAGANAIAHSTAHPTVRQTHQF